MEYDSNNKPVIESFAVNNSIVIPTANKTFTPTCPTGKSSDVLSAEECTLDMAIKLGIADPKNYFINTYDTIKTFNPIVDEKDSKRYNQLCYQSLVKPKESFPNCLIEHGMGFKRKPGQPDKCITAECPPGFEPTAEGCKKIGISDRALKSTKCDERWYDWFMTPNYHLGNKYQKDNSKCYEPCKAGYIPGYVKDPVDNTSLDYSTKEDLNLCVNKYNYFGGKYRNTGDFCPIAIIKRLGSTKEALKDDYIKALTEIQNPNNNISAIEKEIPGEIDKIHRSIQQNMTESDIPTNEYLTACKTLHTEDRLADTYVTCKNLREDSDSITDKYIREGMTPNDATTKTLLLKKACNALFCNKNDDAAAIVSEKIWPKKSCKKDEQNCAYILSGEPICFKEVENSNLDKEIAEIKKKQVELPIISSEKEKYKLNTSFKWMIYFIIVPVFLVIIYGVWTQLLWPYFLQPAWRYISRTIMYLITGFKKSRRQDAIEEQIQQLQDIQIPIISFTP